MDNFIDEIRELKRRIEELEKRNAPDTSIPDPLSVSTLKTDNIEEKTSGAGITFLSQVKGVIPVGTIVPYAGSTSPNGWLLCDGSAVSRTTYSALFAVVGTTYGAGDGSTTFNLPNLKGRVLAGLDTSQTEFNTLGKTGGAKTHTLAINEMPSHTHIQNPHRHWISSANRDDGNGTGCMTNNQMYGVWADAGSYSANDPGYSFGRYSQWETATNQNTGNSQPHNNLQPYITLNYIIKY